EIAEANYLRDGFGSQLTASGFALIEQIRREVTVLQEREAFAWHFEAARLPVPGMNSEDRADLILQAQDETALAVVRCCWCDPEQIGWCFARGGSVRAGQNDERYTFDQIQYRVPNVEVLTKAMLDNAFQVAVVHGAGIEQRLAHWAFAMGRRPAETSEDPRRLRQQVLGPIAEACRYHNGLINHFDQARQMLGQRNELDVLPVVVTNARLWLYTEPVTGSEADSARIQLREEALVETDWVWMQHHQAPRDKHQARRAAYPDRLSELLELDYRRTVAVVNARKIEPFFKALDGARRA
ncbi:MAG: hypothetical protein R3236_05300, partial [Phycisphaeraceae bacterium]|nr:hypothetical protein [Phycisphaeraceae bacterium]